jgi:hypothetical protein
MAGRPTAATAVSDWETVDGPDDWETVGGAPSAPAPAQQSKESPSAFSRFVSGAKEMIPNPVAIAKDYINRPSQWGAVSEVLGTKRGSPEEKAALDKHQNALSNPSPPVVPMGMEPVAGAAEKVSRGDVAGAAGNLAGVAAVGTTLRYAPGVVRSSANAAARGLKESAKKNYRSVLLPSSKKLVPEAEKVAAELAEIKPVALTQKGMADQMNARKKEFGPQAARAYDGKPPVDPAPIYGALEDIRKQKVTVKGTDVVVSEPLNKAIDGLKAKLDEMRDADGRIDAAALDDFKDKLFRGSVDATGQLRQVAPQSAKSIEKGLAGSIKGNLDELYPDAKKINESYSTARAAGDFVEDARRREIAAQSGIITGSSQGFGALTQRMLPRPIRQLPAKITGAFDSTAWNTAMGAGKSALADSLNRGVQRGTEMAGRADRSLFGDYRNPHYVNRTIPPDAGPVPKGPYSAATSAEALSREFPPVPYPARDSALVFEQEMYRNPQFGMPPMPASVPSAPMMPQLNRPRPLQYPYDAGPVPKGPQVKSAEDSARTFLDAEIKDAGPVPKTQAEVFTAPKNDGTVNTISSYPARDAAVALTPKPIREMSLPEVQNRLREVAHNPKLATSPTEFRELMARQEQIQAAQQAAEAESRTRGHVLQGDDLLNRMTERGGSLLPSQMPSMPRRGY